MRIIILIIKNNYRVDKVRRKESNTRKINKSDNSRNYNNGKNVEKKVTVRIRTNWLHRIS